MVECPENNQNNTCKIWCDNVGATDCRSMQIWTTNGYCKDVAVLCVGADCLLGTSAGNAAKIYCGYQQTTDYCNLYEIGTTGKFACNNVGNGFCNNNYTEEACHNITNEPPIAISTTFEETCDEFPTTEPTQDPTGTPTSSNTSTIISTAVPTIIPSTTPTNAPSFFPSAIPTKLPSVTPINTPSITPTITPSNIPSTAPSKSPSLPPTTSPTIESDGEVNADISTTTARIKGDTNEEQTYNTILIVAIGGTVLCLIAVIMGIYCVRKRKQKGENPIKGSQHLQMMNMSIDSTSNTQLVSVKPDEPGNNALQVIPRTEPRNVIKNEEFVIDGEDKTDDGVERMTNEGTETDENDEELIQKQETKGIDFDQELNDNALGNVLMMDDIIDDMNETPN